MFFILATYDTGPEKKYELETTETTLAQARKFIKEAALCGEGAVRYQICKPVLTADLSVVFTEE